MSIDLKPKNEKNTTDQAGLSDLLAELASRTKAVDDTMAANLSDSAYIQALRDVKNTAARVVDQANRAG